MDGICVAASTTEEAHPLGCNTMCLEENVVLMAEEYTRLIKELERRQAFGASNGASPNSRDYAVGIRCASHALKPRDRQLVGVQVR